MLGKLERPPVMRFVPTIRVFLGTRWMVEPAGVAVLTYQHRNMEEPSLFGLNFFTELE